MIKTSEWVSVGHPDKMADYISSYILDRYLEKDPFVRYALEVQIKDNFVTLGGEITSTHHFSDKELTQFVREAVDEIGYTAEYQNRWGARNTICSQEIVVETLIGTQSRDIAAGVDASGWGDQGIFFGMAVADDANDYMPNDYMLAKQIGQAIYNSGIGGLDVKTQVTTDDDTVLQVIVAVPLLDELQREKIERLVRVFIGDAELVINGTGVFQKHGPVGDCGTTGRKLAVDFYGGNCKIGGGSPWTKDATKADLTLNLYARYKALEYLKAHNLDEVTCAISCCIGQSLIRVTFFNECNRQFETYTECITPKELIQRFSLREPIYAELCRTGLFSTLPNP